MCAAGGELVENFFDVPAGSATSGTEAVGVEMVEQACTIVIPTMSPSRAVA